MPEVTEQVFIICMFAQICAEHTGKGNTGDYILLGEKLYKGLKDFAEKSAKPPS